ncbi:MAG TPA: hypothetical protein VMV69_30465 [Pirellulales bacterium]|nr:hypothetical protein [Pirellulales bacterium]
MCHQLRTCVLVFLGVAGWLALSPATAQAQFGRVFALGAAQQYLNGGYGYGGYPGGYGGYGYPRYYGGYSGAFGNGYGNRFGAGYPLYGYNNGGYGYGGGYPAFGYGLRRAAFGRAMAYGY